MPEQETIKRVQRARRAGKAPSTQAGEFVKEEMDHIRGGKHGARSSKQAIAIGLSKARRAGVKLKAPKAGTVSEATRKNAMQDTKNAGNGHRTNPKRALATTRALKQEGSAAASPKALSRQSRSVAAKKTVGQRFAAAKKAARTRTGK